MSGTEQRRSLFDLVSELYDEVRPGYPRELLDRAADSIGLTAEAVVVEVGPGTGQASEYFIERGCRFVGIELGAELTALARRKYEEYGRTEFINAAFEDWEGPANSFDLVLGAQSFHWLEPEAALTKAARLLRPGGHVLLLWSLDESRHTEFWRRGNELHDRYLAQDSAQRGLAEWHAEYCTVLHRHSAFSAVRLLEHEWQREYSAAEWVRLRSTFSPDLALPEAARRQFHRELEQLVNELGGRITRCYRTVCALAERRV